MSEDKKMMDDREEALSGLKEDENGEDDILLLTLDDDTELETVILDIFPFNDKYYIALFPVESEENILIYEYIEGEDKDDIQLLSIESDEEFDAVVAEFGRIIDENDGWADDDCDCEDCSCHDHDHDHK